MIQLRISNRENKLTGKKSKKIFQKPELKPTTCFCVFVNN